VDRDGLVPLSAAAEAITEKTLLVSIQAANNEMGSLQSIPQLAELAHQNGALFHCDATQVLGKLPISLKKAGVDLASFSGHKAYAPKGIGILFVRAGLDKSRLEPLFGGGGQEGRIRPGTLNVPGIVGLGKAAELLRSNFTVEEKRLRRLHELFEKTALQSGLNLSFNGSRQERLPGTISLTIPGVQGDMLISNMPTICISNGSACSAGTMSPSHVLLAMGMKREDAECTVRLGIGRYNTEAEVLQAAKEIASTASRLRAELG
jgi:cysteine desulfurase